MWVQLKVREQLDPAWKEWFEDLDISGDGGKGTLLSGDLADQAALYGLLTKLIKLGLTLFSFESSIIEPELEEKI